MKPRRAGDRDAGPEISRSSVVVACEGNISCDLAGEPRLTSRAACITGSRDWRADLETNRRAP
jgi:hypothetical protein